MALLGKSWVTRFSHLLEEGSTYVIEELCVSQNDIKFRRTNHKFKLSFLGTTRVTPIEAVEIPKNSFDFVSFPNIVKEHRSDLYIGIHNQTFY